MQTIVINHAARTITTYEVTPEIVESIKDLFSMFHSDVEPVYSLGFQRYQKLNKKKKQQLDIQYFHKGHTEAKLFLEAMTEEEFKAYKKSK